jgi:hypothetical protein
VETANTLNLRATGGIIIMIIII